MNPIQSQQILIITQQVDPSRQSDRTSRHLERAQICMTADQAHH